MDTAHKVSLISKKMGFPVTCLGVPKTVDNDLPVTDNCPGFGSVAKYVAVSTREAAMDVKSMAMTSTKVFILEVMGRHAGWIAAAGGLAGDTPAEAPHIILFPEIPFNKRAFLRRVKECVHKYDYCVIVVSEGAAYKNGKFLAEAGTRDAFGHAQLGGVAPVVAQIVRENLGFKYHYAIADYLQRSARHIASAVDVQQAYAVGREAVKYALQGKTAVMPVIKRISESPYKWRIESGAIVTNREQGKNAAQTLHHERWFRHHSGCPPIPRTPDSRRGLPSIFQGLTKVCRPQKCVCYAKAKDKICGMMRRLPRADSGFFGVRECAVLQPKIRIFNSTTPVCRHSVTVKAASFDLITTQSGDIG